MNFTKGITLALVFSVTAVTSRAQVTSKKSLTLDGARTVIAAAIAEAKKVNAPGGVIAVVDEGGNLMALERLDGTFAAGANISIGKARTAVMFKRPTKAFEDIIKNGRTPMIALNDFTPLQGGVPVLLDGEVIGGVGVSGAASAQQDEELAIAGATAAKDSAKSVNVSFFEKAKVKDAFAKGAVLFDGSDKYMVHTSRREKAGKEVPAPMTYYVVKAR
jgi:glc operon protein GlcG